jgi:hypothetical protein
MVTCVRVVTIAKQRILRISGCDGGVRNVNKILNEGHGGKQSFGRDKRRDTNSEKGCCEGGR